MDNRQKSWFLPVSVLGIVFLGLPLLIRDTGSAMVLLLVVMPLLCACFSLFSAWKEGFQWRIPLMTAAWFLCSVPLFYNKTALPYTAGFFLLACLGQVLGASLRRR